jgi:KUP system potassium uptake protein
MDCPDGSWFTLTLSGFLTSIPILWRFGKEEQWQSKASDRFPTSHLVKKDPDGQLRLTDKFGRDTLNMINGFGIFFDKAGETTPAVFSQFLSKLRAAPEVMVFFHLRPLETPSVAPEDLYSVSRLAIPNCYRLIVRHGYMDKVITPDLGSLVCEQVRDFTVKSAIPVPVREVNFTPPSRDGQDAQSETTVTTSETESERELMANDLSKLELAFSRQVLYIIWKKQMKIRAGTNFWRKGLLRAFL